MNSGLPREHHPHIEGGIGANAPLAVPWANAAAAMQQAIEAAPAATTAVSAGAILGFIALVLGGRRFVVR